MKKLFCYAALVAALASHASANEDELTVNADNMEQIQDQRLIRFTGNVEVVFGEMTLRSNEGRALYGDGGPSDLVDYVATGGRVTLQSPDQDVEADEAVYEFAGPSLSFRGSVLVIAGTTRIQSHEMIVHVDEGLTQFKAGSTSNRVILSSTPIDAVDEVETQQ